jgi:tetratricopeptide (TPR) repeat protein
MPPLERVAFWRRITNHRSGDARAMTMLGLALADQPDVAEAIRTLQRAEAMGPEAFRAFFALARMQFLAHEYDAVLSTEERAASRSVRDWGLALLKGRSLAFLGRLRESQDALLEAVGLSPHAHEAAEVYLAAVCATGRGDDLLEACNRLPEAYEESAACVGYRAIALDLLGRDEEARALMNLDRQVAQFRFDPPAEFGDLATFNGNLASEIGANALGDPSTGAQIDGYQNIHLDITGGRAFHALASWVKAMIDRQLAEMQRTRSSPLVNRLPPAGRLLARGFIYKGSAHNGVHMHSAGIVSGVYHVQVPGDSAAAGSNGTLHVGLGPNVLPGYEPRWPKRAIEPVPGTLTLFPSYAFHDFEATHSLRPRVAIGIDLRAA